ncbi:late competence development ComFB family protein [Diplocloster hominis]|uniref:late competence development ComFB family protein n=1 Tax=Diplocloster hominis TaxID=3079010 RepID=UPI0031BA369D
MSKSRTDIDKEIMYRKIMPSAARRSENQELPEVPVRPMSGYPTASVLSSSVRRNSASGVAFHESREMILVNLMEDLVIGKLDSTIQRFNCCKCNKCKKDIAAIALNRLAPKYVVIGEDDQETRQKADERYSSEVTAALVQAILLVKKEPRH